MYHVSIKTDEGSEIITQNEVNNFIKYDENETTENALIMEMVKAARETLEKYLNVSMKSKTYVFEFDGYAVDANLMDVPFGPVVEITSLKQTDEIGTETPLTENTDYTVKGSQFKTLYIPYVYNAYQYTLEYIAGYGGSGVEALPVSLKQAILELVKYWYDREEQDRILPETIKAKVSPYSKTLMI